MLKGNKKFKYVNSQEWGWVGFLQPHPGVRIKIGNKNLDTYSISNAMWTECWVYWLILYSDISNLWYGNHVKF